MRYVKEYIRTSVRIENGEVKEHTCPFTEIQAASVNSVLDEDGVPLPAAKRLIDRWNWLGNYGSVVNYTYRLPGE